MTDLPRLAEVAVRPLPNWPELKSYARLMDSRGYKLSLHDAASFPGEFWLSGINRHGDFRPIRLDLDQVRALRDACDLALAENAPIADEAGGPPTQPAD